MAKIPVTYVRVLVVVPDRREAFGRSLHDGRLVYIDYKKRASSLSDVEICPEVVLGGELVFHHRRHGDALQTYRRFSKHEMEMPYIQRTLCLEQSTERASGA